MALIKIEIDTGNESYSELDNLESRRESLPKVINYLKALNSGAESADFTIHVDGDQRTSSLTVSGTGTQADETFTVNGVDFTYKTSGVSGYTGTWVEVDSSSTDNTASNMASAIEGQSDYRLEGVVGASASGSDVTVTADEMGEIGNAVHVETNATDVSASAGATGTDGSSTQIVSNS